jgi:hypothetical protein
VDGIYWLWDFYWTDPCAGNMKHDYRCEEIWGWYADSEIQFSCAKVVEGKYIANLSYESRLEMSDICRHQVRIGEAVVASDGNIVWGHRISDDEEKGDTGDEENRGIFKEE